MKMKIKKSTILNSSSKLLSKDLSRILKIKRVKANKFKKTMQMKK
jgi:hypothetical protein